MDEMETVVTAGIQASVDIQTGRMVKMVQTEDLLHLDPPEVIALTPKTYPFPSQGLLLAQLERHN